MRAKTKIRVAVTFIWLGFICAISFMEAWIKFTAPGVSLNTGLAIGQVVFAALNKVEIVLAAIIILSFMTGFEQPVFKNIYLMVALALLVVQSVYLLPQLSARVDLRLEGGQPGSSPLHVYYLAAEALKVLNLSTFGFKQLTI